MTGGDSLDEGKGTAEVGISQTAKKNCWDLQPLRGWAPLYGKYITTVTDSVSSASQEHPGSSEDRMNMQWSRTGWRETQSLLVFYSSDLLALLSFM